MPITPFHAYYKAKTLSRYAYGHEKLIAAFASANIEIFPYQVAAALFALRSPYMKGVILCDDGSLGKTYEALLVITQMWYAGRQKILLVIPTPLMRQWQSVIENSFAVPYFVIDSNDNLQAHAAENPGNPFIQPGLVLTTYDFAAEQAEYISHVNWDAVVFEEAHHLRRIYTGENQKHEAIKAAVSSAFKVLLTATPIQTSIMDLYGLIGFIDERLFPDPDEFYGRYFRKPENYPDLAANVRQYSFRTFRHEVENYVKIPKRIPLTIEYIPTKPEKQLTKLLESYLKKPVKFAFPQMEPYDLNLMFWRSFSSSAQALSETLQGVIKRLGRQAKTDNTPELLTELAEIKAMQDLAHEITDTAKAQSLLQILRRMFAELNKLGANRKVLIFTENRATQKFLYELLNQGTYKNKVLVYNGSRSRNYNIIEDFAKEAQILITTDIAAEGFNLEFCSLVINYDMPYNALKMEQRISRCHRQGQHNDVFVVNFLNRDNFADVRQLELVNKRVLQFDGIFGLSDDLMGTFSADWKTDLDTVFTQARHKAEIAAAFETTLDTHKEANQELTQSTEVSLFTSFDKHVSRNVIISPQYIKDKINELNNDLWQLTQYFFKDKSDYICDNATRTLHVMLNPAKVFTGTSLRGRIYSMTDKTLPKSARFTITNSLAKNIISEIFWRGIPDTGEIVVDSELEPCNIGFYEVEVKSKGSFFEAWNYYAFVGLTKNGKILSEQECRKIMDLPVVDFSSQGETFGPRDGLAKSKPHADLDDLVDVQTFIDKTLSETSLAQAEEIKRLEAYTLNAKAGLERELDQLRYTVKQLQDDWKQALNVAQKLDAQKKLNVLQKELKDREQNLFMAKMRLDADMETQIETIKSNTKLTTKITRIFTIQAKGIKNE